MSVLALKKCLMAGALDVHVWLVLLLVVVVDVNWCAVNLGERWCSSVMVTVV